MHKNGQFIDQEALEIARKAVRDLTQEIIDTKNMGKAGSPDLVETAIIAYLGAKPLLAVDPKNKGRQSISYWPWFNHAVRIHMQNPFSKKTPWNTESRRFLTLAFCGEAGELANKIKKEWRGDKLDYVGVCKEISDCFIYLSLIAFAFEMDDIHEHCAMKLNEYDARNK